jgi:hypothetical protein
VFARQWRACQDALAALSATLREAKPDVLLIVSDDQEEMLFEENMPMFQIYWGDTFRLIPRFQPETAPPDVREWAWGYGDVEMDVPVDTELGRYLVEYLAEHDFDIAHSRYMNPQYRYEGRIGPSQHLPGVRQTRARPQGMGHGWSFIIKRLLDNRPIPIVPFMQNTFYPPNTPTPRRCYHIGAALRAAIEAWSVKRNVCVMASGGLSHFVTDEKIDRMALDAILAKDAATLMNLPRNRLYSATSEIKNWITCAAACERLSPRLIDYVPVYRTAGGTGGGWAFMHWQ